MGAQHGALVAHLGGGEADEDRGVVLAPAPRLLLVLPVVEADTEDLVGVGDGRQVGDLVQAMVGRVESRRQIDQGRVRDRGLEVGVAGAARVRNPALDDRAERGAAIDLEGHPAHGGRREL